MDAYFFNELKSHPPGLRGGAVLPERIKHHASSIDNDKPAIDGDRLHWLVGKRDRPQHSEPARVLGRSASSAGRDAERGIP